MPVNAICPSCVTYPDWVGLSDVKATCRVVECCCQVTLQWLQGQRQAWQLPHACLGGCDGPVATKQQAHDAPTIQGGTHTW